MQTYPNTSKKIIIDTRHEHKAGKIGFTILSLSSQKFCIKPFSDRTNGNTLKFKKTGKKHMRKLHHWKLYFTRSLAKFGLEFLEHYTNFYAFYKIAA